MNGIALAAKDISKSFNGLIALKSGQLELHRGEIHAVMGENGSGKSTLLSILSGAISATGGTITVAGHTHSSLTPASARAARIAIVHQEPQLAPTLTVGENILLGRWPGRGPLVSWGEIHARAQAMIDELGIGLDSRTPVSTLSIGRRQMVEIAKGLIERPDILLLDEATSSLDDADTNTLFAILRALRDKGAAIAFVSHRMTEVMSLADRATVLRDGLHIGSVKITETDERSLVSMMVGRDLKSYWHKAEVTPGAPVLEMRDVSRSHIRNVSLTVRAGEIVGLAGLVGSGRSAILRTIAGVKEPDSGTILVDGKPTAISSPAAAHRAGIGYVPEDRKAEGLIRDWSILRNSALSLMNLRSIFAILGNAFDEGAYRQGSAGLKIKASDPRQRVRELSGGNQQKVVISRELATRPKVLLLDEPTRGIDVGAKQ
ncbi:MAG: hypothetical protein RLZZ444_457, partial [Pseudomonadota bacterium]